MDLIEKFKIETTHVQESVMVLVFKKEKEYKESDIVCHRYVLEFSNASDASEWQDLAEGDEKYVSLIRPHFQHGDVDPKRLFISAIGDVRQKDIKKHKAVATVQVPVDKDGSAYKNWKAFVDSVSNGTGAWSKEVAGEMEAMEEECKKKNWEIEDFGKTADFADVFEEFNWRRFLQLTRLAINSVMNDDAGGFWSQTSPEEVGELKELLDVNEHCFEDIFDDWEVYGIIEDKEIPPFFIGKAIEVLEKHQGGGSSEEPPRKRAKNE